VVVGEFQWKLARLRERAVKSEARKICDHDAAGSSKQEDGMRREGHISDARSVSDSVFLNLILKGPETDSQELSRLLTMVGDFRKGSADDFPFDLLKRGA
jgi:hypothetical protein